MINTVAINDFLSFALREKVQTPRKALLKLSPLILLSTVVAALGGLLLGFDTAVIAGTTHGLTAAFALTPVTLGITVSCALWGTVGGGLLASPLGERFGARNGLRWMAILYIVSALGCALAWNWSTLLAFRLIGGLGIGGSSVLSPMYIADISPKQWRGRLVACFQFAVVVGILAAYASNTLVSGLQFHSLEWRFELGAAALPAVLFFVALLLIPESPRWLVSRNRTDEAMSILRRVGSIESESEVERMLAAAVRSRTSARHFLFTRDHRKVIFIALSIGVLNQFSGINAILYYLNDIFAQAGFTAASANVQAVAVGTANLAFTVLAMLLIDSIGRRFLLLIGSMGTAVCLLAVAAIFATRQHRGALLWLLVAYIAFFAISQGTVIWVYLSEIFPPGVREKGQSLGTLALWLTNGLVAAVYPKIASVAGQYPFIFFSVMMLGQFFLTLFVFPETKGLSLETSSEVFASENQIF
jgi:MFS transporter, SP family, arabinose:H+ symporter